MTTYSKDLLWLKPVVDSVRGLVPHIEGVDSIKSFRVPLTRNEQSEAWTHLRKNRFHISIKNYYHLHYGEEVKVAIRRKEYIAKILDSLAHELAHTQYWEHTAEHFRLQSCIMVQFSLVLEAEGYTNTWARFP
jgi:hypothetical protein